MTPDRDEAPYDAVCADCGSSLTDGLFQARPCGAIHGVHVFDLVCLPCWVVTPLGTPLPEEDA